MFLFDMGKKVFQFNGAGSGAFEKIKGAQIIEDMRHKRVFDLVVIDEDSPTSNDDDFWVAIGGKGPIAKSDDSDNLEKKTTDLILFRLSDRTGNLTFSKVAEGRHNIKIEMFNNEDVFLIDKGHTIYIWVGSQASQGEKKSGMTYAQKYIAENHNNLPLPITVIPHSSEHALRGLLK